MCKGYVQNPGVDIKKTATGEVLVGPFVETENSWSSQIMVREILITP